MSKMRKILWSKLRLSYGKKGASQSIGHNGEEDVNSHKGNPSVNEEYNEAFRTKSYTELCDKVYDQLVIEGQSLSPSSIHSLPHHVKHLSEFLLEPSQETITSILKGSGLHHFLINYFDRSQEAGEICESILQDVHQVGINHRPITNITKLTERFPDPTTWTHDQFDTLYKNLASFSTRKNSFSSAPEKFLELHNSHIKLLHQLMSKYKKKKRRKKFIKSVKKVMAGILLGGSGAIVVALIVLAAHSMVGMVAGPGLIVCCLGFLMIKKLKGQKWTSKKTRLEGQLDVAARGVYTLINDLDTMGQLVKGLHCEVERRKLVAGSVVEKGKDRMLKEVVMDFREQEPWFLGQVEELERHVFLCFLNINRARRLLVQEIV